MKILLPVIPVNKNPTKLRGAWITVGQDQLREYSNSIFKAAEATHFCKCSLAYFVMCICHCQGKLS